VAGEKVARGAGGGRLAWILVWAGWKQVLLMELFGSHDFLFVTTYDQVFTSRIVKACFMRSQRAFGS
jgi:hypothetical protein